MWSAAPVLRAASNTGSAKFPENRCVFEPFTLLHATHTQDAIRSLLPDRNPRDLEGSHETPFAGRARGIRPAHRDGGQRRCAHEESKKDSEFAKRLFAADVSKQKKSYVCFVRKYDAAHLAGHPLQKVSAMTLLLNAEVDPEEQSLGYSFRLGVKFRNRPGDFDSSGSCGHARGERGNQGQGADALRRRLRRRRHRGGDGQDRQHGAGAARTRSASGATTSPMTKASISAAALTIACSVSTACRSKCAGRWSPTARNWPRCGPSDTDQMIRTR